jgi:hypothetical protein
VLVSSKLESEEEHDGCGTDEGESDQVQRSNGCAKNLSHGRLAFWFWHGLEKETSADNGT